MKPHITMHMMTSLDGRIVINDWPTTFDAVELYEKIHRELAGDAWIVGPITMAEFAQGAPKPVEPSAVESFPRTTWKAPGAAQGPYAVAVDRKGQLHLNINKVNGDALVCVLSEAVSDEHIAELRRDGISYIFAGNTEVDLRLAVELLAEEFGIKHLLLEGGGGINGAFLDAGLIDDISVLMTPIADGARGAPSIFDRTASSGVLLELKEVSQPEPGVLHLRYQVAR